MKKIIALILALIMCLSLVACGSSNNETTDDTANNAADTNDTADNSSDAQDNADAQDTDVPDDTQTDNSGDADVLESTEISLFIAASLENAFKDIIALYAESQPNVKVTYNADSSGTLLTQIEEGAACDIFFSAATKQVKTLDETDHLMIEGSRVDLLKNQVALITWKGSGTTVTTLSEIGNASSIALADGSVPAGQYTRMALVNLGILPETDDIAAITTEEVSAALGGVEINECGNVSKVAEAIKEGSNEVGTVYYSDAYSVKDYIDVIELIPTELTAEIVYPVCRVQNQEADDLETAAADDFLAFLQTPEVLAIFENYMFIINE